MFRLRSLLTAFWLLVAVQPCSAGEEARLIYGLWKLVSYEVEIQSTSQKQHVMGAKPTGYATFTPDGRVFFVLTGQGRKPASTVQGRADLLASLVAYTGTYRLEGDQWITRVDVAWSPEWVGTEQARTFQLDGDRLHVLTPWRVMPSWPEKGMTRSIITFTRAN